jgi:hypothetical protein
LRRRRRMKRRRRRRHDGDDDDADDLNKALKTDFTLQPCITFNKYIVGCTITVLLLKLRTLHPESGAEGTCFKTQQN